MVAAVLIMVTETTPSASALSLAYLPLFPPRPAKRAKGGRGDPEWVAGEFQPAHSGTELSLAVTIGGRQTWKDPPPDQKALAPSVPRWEGSPEEVGQKPGPG